MKDRKTDQLLTEIVKEISDSPLGSSMTMSLKIAELAATIGAIQNELKDCVNELCLHCCRYEREHLGACDKCRWKKVRRGEDE